MPNHINLTRFLQTTNIFDFRLGVLPFLVATGLFQTSKAGVSVPGPPSSTLEVLGPDQIQVSVNPPISNGGSPVAAYTVSLCLIQWLMRKMCPCG